MGSRINMDSQTSHRIINPNQGNLLCYKTVITYDRYTSTAYSDNNCLFIWHPFHEVETLSGLAIASDIDYTVRAKAQQPQRKR